MKKGLFAAVAAIAAVVIVLVVFVSLNAKTPAPTEEDITAAVLSAYEDDLAKLGEEYGMPGLTLQLEFESFTYEKPAIFKKGSLDIQVKDHYVYPALDTCDCTEDLYKQLITVPEEIKYFCDLGEFSEIELEGYDSIRITRVPDHIPELRDTRGNSFYARTTLYENIIEVNGAPAFTRDTGYSDFEYREGITAAPDYRTACVGCGHKSDYLSSNGYCKTCVDSYFTDY